MTPSLHQPPQHTCGFCGYADAQPFAFCPRCGQPVSSFDDQTRPGSGSTTIPDLTSGSMPTEAHTQSFGPASQPAFQPYQNMPPASFYDPTAGYPHAANAGSGFGGNLAASGAPATSGRRSRKHWGALAGIVMAAVLILGAGGALAYTLLFSYSQTDTARYFPANTIVYTSLDLQQVAQNSHKISAEEAVGSLNTTCLGTSTGLNFQNDVQPWIGRTFTYALVNVTRQNAANSPGGRFIYHTVCLISSRDNNSANAALQKIIKSQQQQYGVTFTSISYGGVTLQSDVDAAQSKRSRGFNLSNTPPPLVLGVVKDQVLIASSVAVANQVIDRFNGTGDTLATNPTFTNAVSKLPRNRFGTLYLNVHELLSATLTSMTGTTRDSSLDTYPTGYGALVFTSQGLRMTFTLEAKAGTTMTHDLSGDTTASASVVPANAIFYAGLGNLSAYYATLKDQSAGILTDSLFRQAVGLAPDDPLFKAPLSVAGWATSKTSGDADDFIDGLLMLHASGDPASADTKVQRIFQHLDARTSTQTISGITVTTIQTRQHGVYKTLAYYAVLGHNLVFGSSIDAISQAIATFQGKQPSLAKSTRFQQMTQQQPKDNALSLFINLDNLANAPGMVGQTYRQIAGKEHSLLSKTSATYVTYQWDSKGITITEDLALK